MMPARVFFSLLLALVVTAPQTPRDQARERTGHALLGGRVVDATHPDVGLRRVDVTLTGGSLVSPRTTRTDEAGRFVFDGLAAGVYRMRATKAGFVATEFGASKPGRPGLSIALADTDHPDVIMPISHGAAVSGTITDDAGVPVPAARVTVLRGQTRYGVHSFVDTLMFDDTDDRGAYRIAGLDAGEYVVVAARVRFNRQQGFTKIAEGEVDLALRDPNTSTSSATPPRSLGFAPAYYPGASSSAQATPITLALGDDRDGVNLTLATVPVARIDGVVTGVDGQPAANALVLLLPRGTTDSIAASQFAPGGLLAQRRTDAAGRFLFAGVDPGNYVLTVSTAPAVGRGAAAPTPSNRPIEWASVDLAINGDDQSLPLALQTARSITGRLVFEGATAPPADMSNARLSIRPARVRAASSLDSGETVGRAETDGRFTIPGVVPGSYWLTATAPGSTAASGWALTSVLVGGREVLDGAIDVGTDADVSDVVVKFSDRPSGVEGTLHTAAGTPASDYFVVVFSKDQTFWRPGSRRIAMARPNSAGAFTVRNLPPGDYLIAALTDVEEGEWFDAGFLTELLPAGKAFVVRSGELTKEDLKIGG